MDCRTEAAARVEGRKRLAPDYWAEEDLVQRLSADIVQGTLLTWESQSF